MYRLTIGHKNMFSNNVYKIKIGQWRALVGEEAKK
jgi:hypothetical protein